MKKVIFFTLLIFSVNFYSQKIDSGKISSEDKSNLIEELSTLCGVKIDESKIIILNYYIKPETEPNGSCIDYYTHDYAYERFIKKNKDIVQFFISEKMYVYKNRKVIEDKNDFIRKLVFTNARRCGNYIIVKPNGEFITKYGEYRQDEIPKLIKQKKLL